MKRLLVILQNPYNKGTLANGWSPGRWKTEFLSSRTGRRLSSAIPLGHEWATLYTNANPKVGDGVHSCYEHDAAHLRRRLKSAKPDIVLACGKVAELAASELWQGALIAVPHPAHRLLTNDLYDKCRSLFESWIALYNNPEWRKCWAFHEEIRHVACDTPRIALRQRRGEVEIETIK